MENIFKAQKTLFLSGKTLPYEFRVSQLKKVKKDLL